MGKAIKSGLDITAGEIKEITDGVLTGGLKRGADLKIDSISTDSRSVKKGELFLALAGDNFDGHEFVSRALKKGAIGAVVRKNFKVTKEMKKQNLLIKVEDTLKAYQDIAQKNRVRNKAKVVAITGSSGKTTTKEMLRNILSVKKNAVLLSEKNYNNHVGVPMTLLKIRKSHEIAVLEVGINQINEMDRLANITNPDIALVTNAGCSHLEQLKNVDTVAYEKMKIANGLKDGGLLIFNHDDLRLLRHSRTKKAKTLTFGFSKTADIIGKSFEDISLNKSRITVKEKRKQAVTFNLKVNGKHNAYNALAAISVARALDIPMNDIVRGLKSFEPKDMRSEILKLNKRIVLINDAYNANPDSMASALTLMTSLKGGKRKIAVLGDMNELGDYSKRAHKEVGAIVSDLNFDHVYFYGTEMMNAAKSAGYCGMDRKKIHWANDLDSLFETLISEVKGGDWIIIKGSRLNRLEIISEKLIDNIGLKDRLTSR